MKSASRTIIVRQGYLGVKSMKKPLLIFPKCFSKTYLVLRCNPFALEQYENDSLENLIDSHDIESVFLVERVNNLKSYQYAFKVFLADEKLIFGCESFVLLDEWINSILEIKNTLKCNSLSSKSSLQIAQSDFEDNENNTIHASSDHCCEDDKTDSDECCENNKTDSSVYSYSYTEKACNYNCNETDIYNYCYLHCDLNKLSLEDTLKIRNKKSKCRPACSFKESGVTGYVLSNDSNIPHERSFFLDKKKKSAQNLSSSSCAINDTSYLKLVKKSKITQLEHRLNLVTSSLMNSMKRMKRLSAVTEKSSTKSSSSPELPLRNDPRRSSEPVKLKLRVHDVSIGSKSFDDILNKEESKVRERRIAENNLKEFQEKLKENLSKKKSVFKNLRQQALESEGGSEPPDLDRNTKPCLVSPHTKCNEHLAELTSIVNVPPPVPERVSSPTPIHEQLSIGLNNSTTSYEGINKSVNANKIESPPLLSPKKLLYNVMENGSIKVVDQPIVLNDEIQFNKKLFPEKVNALPSDNVHVLPSDKTETENLNFNQELSLQRTVCTNQQCTVCTKPTACIDLQPSCTDQHVNLQPTAYMDQKMSFKPVTVCLLHPTMLAVKKELTGSAVASLCKAITSMQINKDINLPDNNVNKVTPLKSLETNVRAKKSSTTISSLPKTLVGPTLSQFPQSKKSLFKFIDVN